MEVIVNFQKPLGRSYMGDDNNREIISLDPHSFPMNRKMGRNEDIVTELLSDTVLCGKKCLKEKFPSPP